jgi:hypothetical protein
MNSIELFWRDACHQDSLGRWITPDRKVWPLKSWAFDVAAGEGEPLVLLLFLPDTLSQAIAARLELLTRYGLRPGVVSFRTLTPAQREHVQSYMTGKKLVITKNKEGNNG